MSTLPTKPGPADQPAGAGRDEAPEPGQESALMPLGDHLEDLRRRLILALFGLVPILVVSLMFGKRILGVLITPAMEALRAKSLPVSFQVTSFFEGFNAYLKLSIAVTILLGAPWVFLQLWRFIAPGLFAHERRFVYVLAPLSAVLTACAGLFLYYVMLPVILLFFVTFNSSIPAPVPDPIRLDPGIVLPSVPMLAADPASPAPGSAWVNTSLSQLRFALPAGPMDTEADAPAAPVVVRGVPLSGDQLISQQYRIAEYVSMLLTFAIALAAGFQMPVVVLLLGWARILTVGFMTKYRRHAVLICVVLGAVLTPADPFSMLLLAIPLWLLFEFGILLLRWLPASRVGGWKDDDEIRGEPNEDPPI